MSAASTSPSTSFWRYVIVLWPLLLIFVLAQLTMRLTGNTASIGLPLWISGLDLGLFLMVFGVAAVWTQWPLARCGRRLSERSKRLHEIMEAVMADLPWRSLKSFFTAGLIFSTYLSALIIIAAAAYEVTLTGNMVFSLVLCFYFVGAILAPTLGVANTIAYAARLRQKLTSLGVFTGDLDDPRPLRVLTGSSRRPWFVFCVTGLFPTTLLAIYVFLALGVDSVTERGFIISQAVVLFVAAMLAGIYLVYTISGTLRRVTRELAAGLAHLREGRFEGRVSVLMDDDLGELARGLNTALKGLQEREDLKGSLKIAAEIQQGLLPRKAPDVPGFNLVGYQQSCHAVGGDYYDYIALPDGRIWLVIADVAGKGYPAALTVANLQAMLHTLATLNIQLEETAAYINRTLCKTMRGGRFVTMFIAKLQPKSHSLLWLNAGHPPPLLIGKEGLHTLEASSPPMGLSKDVSFTVNQELMDPGDVLFAYTDGVTEARDKYGKEMFGEERLSDWLDAHHKQAPARIIERLLRALDDFGPEAHEDDITLLCLRRGGK